MQADAFIWMDPAAPPQVGEVFGLAAVASAIGNPCTDPVTQQAAYQLVVPAGLEVAADEPIFCWVYDLAAGTQAHPNGCPVGTRLGLDGLMFPYTRSTPQPAGFLSTAGWFPIAQGYAVEVQIPVRATRTFSHENVSFAIRLYDANSNPVLRPSVPIEVTGRPTPTPTPAPTVTPMPTPTASPGKAVVISRLRVSPRAFRALSRGGSIVTGRRGAVVSYSLSEAAGVVFGVERGYAGRRVGGKCRKPTRSHRRAKRCTRYVAVKGTFRHAGIPGLNRLRFSGRVGKRALVAGAYRLVAQALAGSRSSAQLRARFRIVRAAR
jgi:hypothetical protein